jgi:rare lipoprotein A
VRVNDRGPFVDDRVIDLSAEAAKRLGFFGKGTAKVKLEVLSK